MTSLPPRVAILLPTFNGEKYLAEQLDSLIGQSYENRIIVTRDDGSTDSTIEVISSYQAKFPDTFHSIENKGSNLGASSSFAFLMKYVLAHKKDLGLEKAYMMFCDQDDIWAEKKVELEMQGMETAEKNYEDIPVLVHSDLRVVSDSGELIAESFMHYQGLEPGKNKLRQILYCNLVTGCTALINEPLAEQSLPIPETAVMHDWWLALVASAFGKLVLIHQPLVHYRQHPSNTLGAIEKARHRSLKDILFNIHKMKPVPLYYDLAMQAKAFSMRYHTRLSAGQKLAIKITSSMSTRWGIAQRVFFRLGRRL
ncbi:MAG: glycosyltransferase family 2 protein [Acidobacteriota bacterium]